jgi:peptidoglycan hydrolase-like protein with peptidoglycan-binding domain
MIIIGSARASESGTANGTKGDQMGGREVSTQAYYRHAKGWYVLRFKSAAYAANLSSFIIRWCANPHVGYGQDDRLTSWQAMAKAGFNPDELAVDVNTDCSETVRIGIMAACGRDVGDLYTGNERDVLLATGLFTDATAGVDLNTGAGLANGDILVTRIKGHTAIVASGAAVRADNTTGGRSESGDGFAYRFTPRQVYAGVSTQAETGVSVLLVQEILKARGYYNGDLDRAFGPRTDAAVRAFQRDSKLAVDGCVGRNTWSALIGMAQSAGGNGAFGLYSAYPGAPESDVYKLSVYLAQEILKARGIYKGNLDKIFGPQMAAAVMTYQRARHLEVDAVIGPKTWKDMIAL